MKYLDDNGLLYLVQKIKGWLNGKIDKEDGKGLSQNDFTNDLKTKYDTVATKVNELTATGGAPNVIETVKVNGTPLIPDSNKAVNVEVPTKLTDLTNDDNFVKDASYVHTDNNYTLSEKQKLEGLKNYDDTEIKNQIAQAGKIDTVKVNGNALTVINKSVDISVPTNNNQIANGAGYQTASDVNNLIANAIGDIQSISISLVQELPDTGENGVLYFVNNPNGENPNSYDEYIWIGSAFEKIGAVDLNLSDYLKSSDAIAITNGEIDTIIA